MTENSLAPTSIKSIMRSDEIKGRFAEVVGNHNAGGYISSVLIAVSENESLQKCSTKSIVGAALRAATMRLSVDPSTGQAYLVPFGGKATLIVGYHGIYHMAIRTGKYRFINLITVYEGETVVEDRMTGSHRLEGAPTNKENVLGYMLYFQLLTGYQKTFYMTCEDCDAHGAKFSKTYFEKEGGKNKSSLWYKDPQSMFKKTVMRLGLLKWGYLDPSDMQVMQDVDEIIPDENVIGGIAEEILPTPEQSMKDLGFGDSKQKTITREEVARMANEHGVNPEGLDEIYARAGGDISAVYEQLKAI